MVKKPFDFFDLNGSGDVRTSGKGGCVSVIIAMIGIMGILGLIIKMI